MGLPEFRFTLSHVPKPGVNVILTLPDFSTGYNVSAPAGNNIAANTDWALGATPTVTLPGSLLGNNVRSSNILTFDFSFITGYTYQISYSFLKNVAVNTGGQTFRFVLLDSSNTILSSYDISYSTGIGFLGSLAVFTAPANAIKFGYIAILGNLLSNSGSSFTITSESGVSVSTPEPGSPTSKIISEPDGWKDAKLILERHPDFHSLVEYFESDFIFYGSNGVVDGGINYIRAIEQRYGYNAKLKALSEVTFDGVTYDLVFAGLIQLSSKQGQPNNKIKLPIIRDDIWSKFINRLDTPVDLSSGVDIDGNIISPVNPVNIELSSQTIRSSLSGYLSYGVEFEKGDVVQPDWYLGFSWDEITLDEFKDDKYGYFTTANIDTFTDRPSEIFSAEYGGDYTFDIRIELSYWHTGAFKGLNGTVDHYVELYLQVNEDTPIQLSRVDYYPVPGTGSTTYTYNDTIFLSARDAVRVYGVYQSIVVNFDSGDFVVVYGRGNNYFPSAGITQDAPSGVDKPSYIKITGDTVFEESTAQGYLLHDAFAGVINRIVGSNCFYSNVLGSSLTKMRTYASDGCYWNNVLIKGLQVRGYSLSEKPFFISFNDLWRGADPMFCLSLGYETVSGNPSIRIENRSYHYNSSSFSTSLVDVLNPVDEYDEKVIPKTIEIGYEKWESENSSGIDDPQTEHTYGTISETQGTNVKLKSGFVAASLAIETTRRKSIEKSEDYKFDNDNFIILLNETALTADTFTPELSEKFTYVTGLLNYGSRYNIAHTPLRMFLRHAHVFAGAFQKYLTSTFMFMSGKGNYSMVSDYNCSTGKQCLAIICDPLSERSNIDLGLPGNYHSVFGYLHLPDTLSFEIDMSWDTYKSIRNQRNISVRVSQTEAGFKKYFIKKLEYLLCRSEAKMELWAYELDSYPEVTDSIQPNGPDCGFPPMPDPITCPYEPEYCAILDRASDLGYTLPSESCQIKQNNLVIALKSAGVFSKLDVLYVFAGDGSADFATINWINPNTYQASKNNAIYTNNVGFRSGGSSGVIFTNYVPLNDTNHFTLNGGSVFCYVPTTSVLDNTYAFGALGGSGGVTPGTRGALVMLIKVNATGQYNYAVNTSGGSVGSPVSYDGFYHIQRTASNAQRLLVNGTQIGTTNTAVPLELSKYMIHIFGYNNNGSNIGNDPNMNMGIWGIGESLSGSESALYNAWTTYYASL
jgi:hypothetical protein